MYRHFFFIGQRSPEFHVVLHGRLNWNRAGLSLLATRENAADFEIIRKAGKKERPEREYGHCLDAICKPAMELGLVGKNHIPDIRVCA